MSLYFSVLSQMKSNTLILLALLILSAVYVEAICSSSNGNGCPYRLRIYHGRWHCCSDNYE